MTRTPNFAITSIGLVDPGLRPGVGRIRHPIEDAHRQRADFQVPPLGRVQVLAANLFTAKIVLRSAVETDFHAIEPDLLGHFECRDLLAFADRPVAGTDTEGARFVGQQRAQPGRQKRPGCSAGQYASACLVFASSQELRVPSDWRRYQASRTYRFTGRGEP